MAEEDKNKCNPAAKQVQQGGKKISRNGTMMQYFEWYLPNDGTFWNKAAAEAENISDAGITAVWFPPAYKGQAGINDVGYGVYDLYDLGEFDQKGTVRTKYGTKDEYLAAIRACHKAGMDVYADMVFNHKMGADYSERVKAYPVESTDRTKINGGEREIEAWTGFNFPGRKDKYSDFHWDHTCFDGVDWDQRTEHSAIYEFENTPFDKGVDKENGNYDYLMGADLAFSVPKVREELYRYGLWYLDFTGVDGFRLDAVKHIENNFFGEWLDKLRKKTGRELFAVGEYWQADLGALKDYLNKCWGAMSLFDVPLHMHFFQACHSGGHYDMRTIFDDTLVQADPCHAVTFVANHDTQKGQALQTVIENWFKPLAYAMILLRPQGYPCVFYGDYYGVACKDVPPFKDVIDKMLAVRRDKLYGEFHDYLDNPDIIGWTCEGDEDHKDSGCAVLVDDGPAGEKIMYVGKRHSNEKFIDVMGNQKEEVIIDDQGNGCFKVDGGSVSVYVKRSEQ
ncbi:MAG: alpha-amylase [Eubacteriales bacterium]|jgi:alpha-amylase